MTLSIRPASTGDIRQMAEVIGLASGRELAEWMDSDSAYTAWHVAENEAGRLVGVQRVGLGDGLPTGACEIATFLTEGPGRMAAGSRLFEASAEAARLLGYDWINAAVAEANEGALIYYQSRGFRPWDMRDGKVLMRYDLD